MNASPNRKCRGTTKAGVPCGAASAEGSLYCAFHDPERVEERREWQRMGGKASGTQRRLQRLIGDVEELGTGDLMRLLSGALLMTLEGKLEPSHLSALQGAAKTLDTIRRTAELERRLARLETTIAGGYGRRAG